MLEEFMGIPAHPFLVHAAVVFVPLLALTAVGYAFVPFVRPHLRWVLGLLAVATPLAALMAKLSGDRFLARLESRNRVSPEYVPRLAEHQDLGTNTLYATIALGVLTLALVFLVKPRATAAPVTAGTEGSAEGGAAAAAAKGSPVLTLVLGVLSLAAAGITLYYVFRTGDTGAQAVWQGQ
ncbi:DUF2231 domain-containing protein [Plantactinospora sp. KLBMP9567]|uniref:DUF2231 domain-containing protein n=1 Tax=Plantactinospora sp. KLBMP9567 TaxID=3085900 RepID=UPI002981411D|nr:DUF2231 domain-containing protein [Plantactinospora sp. KLBMP9567]MDW5329343.1 DUF2231 domain-containing protein [Plantactinospora sp. KLBMP9567]